MSGLIWRQDACADLRRIQNDIRESDPVAADDFLDRVGFYAERAFDHPNAYGRSRHDGLHEVLVNPNYVMVYHADPGAVEIVAVMHTCRQYPPAADA